MENKVPYYDPQTGEINHKYEELTGHPNPLLGGKQTKIDFKRRNGFLVHFPESFNIKSEQVQSIKLPSFSGDIKLKLREYNDTNTFSQLNDYLANNDESFEKIII